MPSILNLKFKGNKSFVAFSNLNDTESLTKTWKVCTKVASYLEQGQRLENLSWRLWHLQNLMVDTDNAKSKREFKKLSKCMGDKLDKEKGRSIEELEAPDFKRNHSTDMIRQRAVEKERNREASQNAKPGTIKRMQFTFSVDQLGPASNIPVKKPDTKPSLDLSKRTRATARAQPDNNHENIIMADDEGIEKEPPITQRGRKDGRSAISQPSSTSLRFPSLFSNDFGPSALLNPSPTFTTHMNYGEGLNASGNNDSFCVSRPTIELPLDELLHGVDSADSPDLWSTNTTTLHFQEVYSNISSSSSSSSYSQDVVMSAIPAPTVSQRSTKNTSVSDDEDSGNSSDDEYHSQRRHTTRRTSNLQNSNNTQNHNNSHSLKNIPPLSQAVKEILPETVSPSKVNPLYGTRANTPTGRPTLTVRTQATPTTRSSGPGATATSLNPAVLRSMTGGAAGSNSAPGGVKAECSNCGATHTPLWRRGLNDELNCNACGLYCKLHKRPRPKSMRNTHGEGRAQAAPRQETVDVMTAAQCYNCHTTATPLWRKDDEGKTVCNACGLYYKLHGSARPISMKSDVIRKRSRHDARRSGQAMEDTPSASPGVSRRASPALDASPTLAPDSTTQMTYEYSEEMDYRSTQSELIGALGNDHNTNTLFQNAFQLQFPGPYHPDYLSQLYNVPADTLPFSSVESSSSEVDPSMSPRSNKRRRMSTDSASEPPSSAISYSSYNDGYSSASSATSHSQRSSMEFPFSNFNSGSTFNNGPALRGSGNTFWHPPMMPQGDSSPHIFHPPMLPPAGSEESPMDYLHPPMVPQDDESLFSTYLHPPMVVPEEGNNHLTGVQSQNIYGDYSHGHDYYDASMQVY